MSKREERQFMRVFANIKDDKVRYFFAMLADAVAQSSEQVHARVYGTDQANTSQAHVVEIARRLNKNP